MKRRTLFRFGLPLRYDGKGPLVGELNDKSDDIEWAMALLNGYLEYESPGAVPRHRYIEGGADEHRARRALHDVLTSEQPDRDVLETLADMACPFAPSVELSPDRMLTFTRQVKQGHIHRNANIRLRVAKKLYEVDAVTLLALIDLPHEKTRGKTPIRRKDMSTEKACVEVAEDTGLTYETVDKIWKGRRGLKRKPKKGI